VQGISEVWGKIGGVDPLSFEFDEVCSIKSRLSQATSEVHTRMHESMHDAVSTGNAKKKTALLGFAREWDAICPKQEGSDGALLASLEAEASEKKTEADASEKKTEADASEKKTEADASEKKTEE